MILVDYLIEKSLIEDALFAIKIVRTHPIDLRGCTSHQSQ
jgi:hypothetical protein